MEYASQSDPWFGAITKNVLIWYANKHCNCLFVKIRAAQVLQFGSNAISE
jgi:hypothetical protein